MTVPLYRRERLLNEELVGSIRGGIRAGMGGTGGMGSSSSAPKALSRRLGVEVLPRLRGYGVRGFLAVVGTSVLE